MPPRPPIARGLTPLFHQRFGIVLRPTSGDHLSKNLFKRSAADEFGVNPGFYFVMFLPLVNNLIEHRSSLGSGIGGKSDGLFDCRRRHHPRTTQTGHRLAGASSEPP